jgi:hypothetical protein
MPLAALVAALFAAAPGGAPDPAATTAEPPRVDPAALLAPGARLAPSERARALHGRRVKLVGYMAELEEAPKGTFFLASRPVRCDEGGAGTGDLPPDAVRVVVRSAQREVVPFYPGRLEATGVLLVGNTVDDEGRPAMFQLVLDRPADLQRPGAGAAAR